ncbi:MAG: hypothetical protein C0443_15750 [Comamonadaceae bacterium]|nr:hypothetical protein [Comamonadaceae bacterium]
MSVAVNQLEAFVLSQAPSRPESSAVSTTAVRTLRQRTAVLHQTLESCTLATVLMSPRLTVGQYVQALSAWGGAWRLLEAHIATSASGNGLAELAPSSRADLAVQDLGYLGANTLVEAERQRHTAQHVQIFDIDSDAELLGVYYVLRGSMLGAKVIGRHLHQVLGLNADHGAAFFARLDESSLPWPRWLERCNQYLQSAPAVDAAAQGAVKTFSYLLDWFEACTPSAVDRATQTRAPTGSIG